MSGFSVAYSGISGLAGDWQWWTQPWHSVPSRQSSRNIRRTSFIFSPYHPSFRDTLFRSATMSIFSKSAFSTDR